MGETRHRKKANIRFMPGRLANTEKDVENRTANLKHSANHAAAAQVCPPREQSGTVWVKAFKFTTASSRLPVLTL